METDNPEMAWTLILQTSDLIKNYAATMGNTAVDRITLAQQSVLSVVYSHHGGGVRVKDIAEELHLTPGAVSQTVEALVREGIVERVTDDHDRRAVLIRPSEKGRKIKEMASTHIGQIMRDVLAEVDDGDIEGFIKVINLVMEKVHERYETLKKTQSVRTSARMKTSVRMKTSERLRDSVVLEGKE